MKQRMFPQFEDGPSRRNNHRPKGKHPQSELSYTRNYRLKKKPWQSFTEADYKRFDTEVVEDIGRIRDEETREKVEKLFASVDRETLLSERRNDPQADDPAGLKPWLFVRWMIVRVDELIEELIVNIPF